MTLEASFTMLFGSLVPLLLAYHISVQVKWVPFDFCAGRYPESSKTKKAKLCNYFRAGIFLHILLVSNSMYLGLGYVGFLAAICYSLAIIYSHKNALRDLSPNPAATINEKLDTVARLFPNTPMRIEYELKAIIGEYRLDREHTSEFLKCIESRNDIVGQTASRILKHS